MHKIPSSILVLFVAVLLHYSCTTTEKSNVEHEVTNKVILSSDVVWQKLNPARGDKSPQAGTLWGDRNGEETTGFLAKFVDGFSSPPHIHNVTYRAVVINGTIHNDDPDAEFMWMTPGSFWTQPAGEIHITAAQGEENIALVEIDKAPYLVKPTEQAFDNGERPINIDASNSVWLDSESVNSLNSDNNVQVSYLLQQKDNSSLFIKLPQGFKGEIESFGEVFHAVVIQGELIYAMPNDKSQPKLDVGSYFGAESRASHLVENRSEDNVIVYIRTNGKLNVN